MSNLTDLLGSGISIISDLSNVTVSASDPAVDTNPSAVGGLWLNKTSGEMFTCTDATAGANVWTNVGDGADSVKPITFYGDRAIAFSVGNSPSIDYFNIASTGNASDFGDSYISGNNRVQGGGCSDGSRGVLSSEGSGVPMQYVTISTLGNSSTFGAATSLRKAMACSNGVRGLFAGGSGPLNIIDYITIANTGNATDFGDLVSSRNSVAALSNKNRAVFCGGNDATSPYVSNIMEYVNPASTSNTTDFGDLVTSIYGGTGMCGDTRGIICGGYTSGSPWLTSSIQYITVSSTGNASTFGSLLFITGEVDCTGNSTRGVIAGGNSSSYSLTNQIQYLTISSTGNTSDFGDLTAASAKLGMCSGD